MKVDDLMADDGDNIFYDDAFRKVLEDHVSLLKTASGASSMLLEPHLAYKFKFDLSAYLLTHNIPIRYHWIVMRCNDLTSPQDAFDDKEYLIIPNFDYVERILQTYKSTNRTR